jgi:cytochrome oxidase Cu insertion factor (SCO1/SenC/PrrC family)
MRAIVALAATAVSVAVAAHELGGPAMDFAPPPAGSYVLQAIQRAPAGRVVDAFGRTAPLAAHVTGRITLLSFVYTYCTDPTGCPLAYDTFVTLRERIARDKALAGRVRLVSLSFDPTNDSPEAMRAYGGKFVTAKDVPWHFLTTRSVRELGPILEGFSQDVEVELDDKGRETRVITHLLKVFLIDRHGVVREIYTTAFLLPDMMMNDIRTLALEEGAGL